MAARADATDLVEEGEENEEKQEKRKQGRIHGYPSRVRVGRSSAGEGH